MAYIINQAYFVEAAWIFKNYSNYLDNNIDVDSIAAFILEAQDMETQQLLGYTLWQFYVTLLTPTTPGDPTTKPIFLTENYNYKYLLDVYLQRSVALHAIHLALPTIHYRITNKSIVTKNSQFSQPVSKTALIDLKNDILSKAQFYDQRVREWIYNNPSNYPEYWETTGVMRMFPKSNVYFGGIYLPDVTNKKGLPCCGQGMGLGFPLNF